MQPGSDSRVTGRKQAGESRDAQVAGDSFVIRGEPGQRPPSRGLSPVKLLIGPGDLDSQADNGLHLYGEPAAGQGQADDPAQRVSQHDYARTWRDDSRDGGREAVERIRS